jgi:hypothetical protein
LYKFYDYYGDERLNSSDLLVFIFICGNQDYCSKSAPSIGQATRLGTQTVYRSIHKLRDLGLIDIEMVTKRPWKIWPQIEKHTTTMVVHGNRHATNWNRHATKKRRDMLPPWEPNNNININKHSDFEIYDEDKTAEQMKKLGLNLEIKPVER